MVWVRRFGHIYGNTIHSATIVVAVFMVGLGAVSDLFGTWADRCYQSRHGSRRDRLWLLAPMTVLMGGTFTALIRPGLVKRSATWSQRRLPSRAAS